MKTMGFYLETMKMNIWTRITLTKFRIKCNNLVNLTTKNDLGPAKFMINRFADARTSVEREGFSEIGFRPGKIY